MFLYLFEFTSVALLVVREKRTHCYGSGHLPENGYYRSDVKSAATQMIIETSETFVTHSGVPLTLLLTFRNISFLRWRL